MRMSKLWIALILSICLCFFAACQPPAPIVRPSSSNVSAPPIKHFNNSEEYLKEGKAQFDAQQIALAQEYLAEAIRLDPENQAAHALAGEAYVKLGKGRGAQREFEKVIQINSKTNNAALARDWLERFNNPLPLAIPAIKDRVNVKYQIENYLSIDQDGKIVTLDKNMRSDGRDALVFYAKKFMKEEVPNFDELYRKKLVKVLLDSGFYSMVDSGNMTYGRKEVDWSRICRDMNQKGAKIIALGSVDFTYKNEGGRNVDKYILANMFTTLKYLTITAHIVVDLYAVKGCQSIAVLKESQVIDNVPYNSYNKLDPTVQDVLETLFEKIAVKVHNALL